MPNSKRKSIEIEGVGHGKMPIPMASLKGGLLATGAVYGWQPGEAEAGIEPQVCKLFSNLEAILTAAGGSMDDIVKMSVTLASGDFRATLNEVWTAYFPDPHSRPARHVKIAEIANRNRLIATEILAVIEPA